MTCLKVQHLYSVFSLGLLAVGLVPPVTVAQSATNQCDLSGAIAAITSRPEHQKSHWGIAVQDIGSDQIIYQENADKLFTPASNLKLLTTAIALEEFGKDYQFQTKIYTFGNAPDLDRLVLKGGGQPTLTSAILETALEELKSRGITHIKEVIIDDSYFTELAINPTWEWSDLPAYYAVPVNSFILDQNVVILTLKPSKIGQPARIEWSDEIAVNQWELDNQLITVAADTPYKGELSQQYGTTKLQLQGQIALDADADIWALSIPDSAQYAVDKVEQILLKDQITVGKKTVLKTPFANLENIEPFTTISSAPLADIIRITNSDSNNLFAESLRQTLISEAVDIPATLTNLGVDAGDYYLKDGSGLSRHNLVTPMAFVEILDGMAEHPEADIYKNSLAIAATSGTLSSRFQDTPIAGQFFGKTGTMTNVGALSGYLNIDGDRRVALSILVNQSEQSGSVTRRGIDDVVGAIYDWGQCSGDRP